MAVIIDQHHSHPPYYWISCLREDETSKKSPQRKSWSNHFFMIYEIISFPWPTVKSILAFWNLYLYPLEDNFLLFFVCFVSFRLATNDFFMSSLLFPPNPIVYNIYTHFDTPALNKNWIINKKQNLFFRLSFSYNSFYNYCLETPNYDKGLFQNANAKARLFQFK